jgi:transposase-like protein
MSTSHRFQDVNLRLSDFEDEVWVECPGCTKKAIATANHENKKARLLCSSCGYNKEVSTMLSDKATLVSAAHIYFDTVLWLQIPFRSKEVFFAYNDKHLSYLEQYIGAQLREHKARTHFTLLEKLPKFYHEANNREALLQLIERLKKK